MTSFSLPDHHFMQRAISLAKRGHFTTSPNPRVGCVLVKNGEIIGEGFHKKAGQGHAEVHALKQAGVAAKGATAYVTLEPCSHYGLTPPCAEALIKAKVSHVIAAMVDPNPKSFWSWFSNVRGRRYHHAVWFVGARCLRIEPGFYSFNDHKNALCAL